MHIWANSDIKNFVLLSLFILGSFNDAFNSPDYTESIDSTSDEQWTGNYMQGMSLVLNLRHYLGIWVGKVMQTTKKLSWGSLSSGRDLNQRPYEYEAGVLTVWSRC
jgi:hypothetical protein